MKFAAVSDLHLGSRFSRYLQFSAFLRTLPAETCLILNGDTVDTDRMPLHPEHQEALALLCEESFKRRIVWINGNHDRGFVPTYPNQMEFVESWTAEGGLHFAHGDRFIPIYPVYRVFSSAMQVIRRVVPSESLLTIRFAVKFPLLFRSLMNRSTINAIRFARKHGYHTIVCGHLHMIADTTIGGIRYVNIGTWTEWPAPYLSVKDGVISIEHESS